MKALIAALTILVSGASASAATSAQLLSLLLRHSEQLNVSNWNGRFVSHSDFSDVLAAFLAPEGEYRTSVTSTCTPVKEGEPRLGATLEDCKLAIKTTSNLKHANDTTLTITFKTSTPVVPKASPTLVNYDVQMKIGI